MIKFEKLSSGNVLILNNGTPTVISEPVSITQAGDKISITRSDKESITFLYSEAVDASDVALGATPLDVAINLGTNFFSRGGSGGGPVTSVTADQVTPTANHRVITTAEGTTIGIHGMTAKDLPISEADEMSLWDSVSSLVKKITIANLKLAVLSWLPKFMQYQEQWDASTNTPTLTSPDTSKTGFVYKVSVAGTRFGIDWKIGDWLIYNASGIPEVSDNSDATRAELGLSTTDSPNFADTLLTGLGSFFGSAVNSVKGYLQAISSALSSYTYTPNFQFLNQKGTPASDSPTLGAELLTSSGWTTTGWTGDFVNGFTHTAGNTSVLSNTFAAINATRYYIAFTVTGRTAGSFTVSFGGQSQASNSSTGVFLLLSTSTANLQITPTSDFNGTIVLSIKQITAQISATQIFYSSDSTITSENRISAKLLSLFFGINSGRFNYGQNNVSFGNNSQSDAIIGNNNVNIGSGGHASIYSANGNTNSGHNGQSTLRSGSFNTNTGADGQRQLLSGSNNTNCGVGGAYANSAGSSNNSFGYNAMRFIFDGITALTSISFSSFFGAETKASANGVTNENVFGYNATGKGSNTFVFGTNSITKTYTYGDQYINDQLTSASVLLTTGTIVNGATFSITAKYILEYLTAEFTVVTAGSISIGTSAGLSDVVAVTSFTSQTVGNVLRLIVIANESSQFQNARTFYVTLTGAASIKLHYSQKRILV